MIRFLAGFCVAMFLSFFVTAIYLGYYKSVNIEEVNNIEFQFLYTEHSGNYGLINESITKVENWAKENKINCTSTFGHYLDDPQVVKDKNLRSEAGCILRDEIAPELIEASGFKIKSIKLEQALKASFSGSPALGPLKVYPKANDWFDAHQKQFKTSIEVYHLVNEKYQTEYFFPIEK